jgi:YD repeat-containing protein
MMRSSSRTRVRWVGTAIAMSLAIAPCATSADTVDQNSRGSCSPPIAYVNGAVTVICQATISSASLEMFADAVIRRLNQTDETSHSFSNSNSRSLTPDFARVTTSVSGGTTQQFPSLTQALKTLRGRSFTATTNEGAIFSFDQGGRLLSKISTTEVLTYTYNDAIGKITSAIRYKRTDPTTAFISQFEYNSDGDMVFIKNNEEKGVKLFYDNFHRVRSVVNQDRIRIDFKYNEDSRPVEITEPSLGTINIWYKQSGEIAKIESTALRSVGLKVRSMNQTLLELFEGTGISIPLSTSELSKVYLFR